MRQFRRQWVQSPNFLAFNLGATLSNGGIPQGPETVVFSQAVDTVSVNAGDGSAGNITLECFASGGGSVGQQTIVGNPTLQPLSVSASGQIARDAGSASPAARRCSTI